MNAFLYTLEVNGYHQLFGCQHSSKYLILCSKERNSYRFETNEGEQIMTIFILGELSL